jgi:hypothetical protein
MRKTFIPILFLLSGCAPDGSQIVKEMHSELEEMRSESAEVRRRTDSAVHLLEEMGPPTKEVIIKREIQKEIQRDTVVIEREPERVMMSVRPYQSERPRIIRDTIYIYRIDTFLMDVD